MSHPKAREWIVSAARANYQELSKLANDHPTLVRLHVSEIIRFVLFFRMKLRIQSEIKLLVFAFDY